ncbi:MAG: BLUF domain-containing protein [Gammaproteobacteria bacterium]|jgi:hypothetical protein
MFRLIYASLSDPALDGSEVYSLLAKSKSNNQNSGVTGVLIYGQGYFLQVLEGNRDQVNSVFQRIFIDQRHHDVRIIAAEDLDARDFDTWSMEIIGWPDELDSSMKQILKETTGHDELKPFELDGTQVISLLKKLVRQEGLLGRL